MAQIGCIVWNYFGKLF